MTPLHRPRWLRPERLPNPNHRPREQRTKRARNARPRREGVLGVVGGVFSEERALRRRWSAERYVIAEKKTKETGKTVQTKDGPLDVAASCAKRLAAMKLCEQIPFPGSTIGSSSVES